MKRWLLRMRGIIAKPPRNWTGRRTCSSRSLKTRRRRFGSRSNAKHRTFAIAANNCKRTSTTPAFANRCSRNPTTAATQKTEHTNQPMKTFLSFRKTTIVGLSLATILARTADTWAESGYAAHEWGTFTSVQGSDGVQLDWHAQQVSE